jgi:lipid II:glycine glycyltransferase (peptidoglycan interpeptide bridge formation enzyme)
MIEINETEWAKIIYQLPGSHFLQSQEWGKVKSDVGWLPVYIVWKNNDEIPVAGAMVLERILKMPVFPFQISLLYIPKGPLLDWTNMELVQKVLQEIQEFAQKRKAIFIKIDPDVPIAIGIEGEDGYCEDFCGVSVRNHLQKSGWLFSNDQIQFRNTVIIDLTLDKEDLLARMKQKTRYNIRLAEKKGVVIRDANRNEYPDLYRLYAQTALRDQFTIRSQDYYIRLWNKFADNNLCDALIAEYEGKLLAGLFLFYFGLKAYYVYGMSGDEHRNLMPTYLLQWAAIQRAKEKKLETYDLWGAPNQFNETDSMWGVFRFKQGIGGYVIQTIGAWDYVVSKPQYFLYQEMLPRFLNILRRKGKKATQSSV